MNTWWTRRDFLAISIASGLTIPGCKAHMDTNSRLTYSQKVLAKHPVGYWRLGEANGPTAVDVSKQGHDGSYHGATVFGETGATGDDTAIKIDGRSSYVEIPDSVEFSQPTSGRGLTVEVWMRPDLLVFPGETSDPYIHWLGKGEAGRYEWGFRFYSHESSRPNRISAYIWNASGAEGSGAYFQDAVEVGKWIHVAACYDPGDRNNPQAGVSIYTNGMLRGSPASQHGALYKSFDIMPAHGPAPLRLGTRDLKSFLTGGLDEVAIYPRVLTGAEIQDNYSA